MQLIARKLAGYIQLEFWCSIWSNTLICNCLTFQWTAVIAILFLIFSSAVATVHDEPWPLYDCSPLYGCYLFMSYLAMLSVARAVSVRLVGWVVNNIWEGYWRKQQRPDLKYSPGTFPEWQGKRKRRISLVRIASLRTYIEPCTVSVRSRHVTHSPWRSVSWYRVIWVL
jgi:hypothetical protein